MQISLDPQEVEILLRPVGGNGGVQDLLRKLQSQLDRTTGIITLDLDDLRRIPKSAAWAGGRGGFQQRLRRAFGRTLGEDLHGP